MGQNSLQGRFPVGNATFPLVREAHTVFVMTLEEGCGGVCYGKLDRRALGSGTAAVPPGIQALAERLRGGSGETCCLGTGRLLRSPPAVGTSVARSPRAEL